MRAPYPFLQHGLCFIPLLFLLGVIWLGIGSEDAVFAFFTAWRLSSPLLTWWITLFTYTANTLFYIVYIVLFVQAIRRGSREQMLFVLAFVLAQILVAALLSRFIKIAVGRPRPMTGGPFIPFSFGWGYQSFPSGHTVEAVGICLPLAQRYGKVLLPLGLGVYIACIGFSRLYLGMHHPTDLLGGMVLGSLTAYLTWLFARLAERRWNRPAPLANKSIPATNSAVPGKGDTQ